MGGDVGARLDLYHGTWYPIIVTLSFVQFEAFVAKWRRLKLTDEDLQELERLVMERPDRAPLVQGTGGLRKLRFAPPSWYRGKSGAIRVCYVHFPDMAQCHFLFFFGKDEQPNLSAAQKAELKKLIAGVKDFLHRQK